jgi:hypothetical protein
MLQHCKKDNELVNLSWKYACQKYTLSCPADTCNISSILSTKVTAGHSTLRALSVQGGKNGEFENRLSRGEIYADFK